MAGEPNGDQGKSRAHAEREAQDWAWFRFFDHINKIRQTHDGSIPIALICVAIRHGDDPSDMIWNDLAQAHSIWPAEFPLNERAPLLRRLASAYDPER
jgi:hypothetical protein